MKRVYRTYLSGLFLSFVLLFSLFVSGASSAEALFSKAPVALSAAVPSGTLPNFVSNNSFIVTANAALLKNSTPGTEVMAQLDDSTYIGIKTQKIRITKNGLVWIGTVEPEYGNGSAFLFIKNSIMAGRIIFNGQIYQVTSLGSNNLHKITDLEGLMPLKNMNDALPAPVEEVGDQENPPLSYAVPEGEGQTTIDLLLLYTPEVAQKHPGDALDTFLNSLVELANQAYINSNINLKLNLVGEKEVNYPDNVLIDSALNALTSSSGVFSQVPTWRNEYGADLVCLVRAFTEDNQYCGLAWLLQAVNNPSGTQGYGFSVIQTGSASGYYCDDYTLAHEIGHNLGCQHDKAHAYGSNGQLMPGLFDYSYGYDKPGIFATIMSYNSPTIPYFSNPDITYQGYAIGVAGEADNAETIRQTMATVASYRQSVFSGGGGDDGSGDTSYCTSQGDSQQYEWISKVQVGSFSNSSGASKYSDFTSKNIDLPIGSSVTLNLTPGFSGKAYNEYWKVWIDYNKDGDFSDPGENVFSGYASTAKLGAFVVSASASGSTRMRVSMQYNAYPPACGSFRYGEVEDYTVTFVDNISGGGDDGGDSSTDYCSSQGDSQQYEWISKVQVGSFTNTSNQSHYSDYTLKNISLTPGQAVSLRLTPGFASYSYPEYWKVWIDYNKDGDFSDPGENVFSGSASASVSGSFTVPSSASGSTRMRVSMQYKAYPPACGPFKYGEVEDYTVTFGPPPEPVAPVADFSADHTYVQTGSQVHFIDQSSNNPTSWSWTFQGGSPSSSTQENPTITYNSPGDYPVTLSVSNSVGSDSKTKTSYIHVTEKVVSYCTSQGNNQAAEWIGKVQIGNFSSESGPSPYSDFLSKTVLLTPGQTVSVILTPGFAATAYPEYWIVWIDYNKDGDFSDPGELVFSGMKNTALSGGFTVASNATGSTRMRVAMSRIVPPKACGTFLFGEVEDYTVEFSQ